MAATFENVSTSPSSREEFVVLIIHDTNFQVSFDPEVFSKFLTDVQIMAEVIKCLLIYHALPVAPTIPLDLMQSAFFFDPTIPLKFATLSI